MNDIPTALLSSSATMPTRAMNSAGLDLYSTHRAEIYPGKITPVHTGIAMEIPEGWCGQIWPRSGLASRNGFHRLAGLIDANYRGEIIALMTALKDEPEFIEAGGRFAQLVIVPIHTGNLVRVEVLSGTYRGSKGFGSTGV